MDEVHQKYIKLMREKALEEKDKYEFLLPHECDFAPYKALVYYYMARKYRSVPEKIHYLTTNCSLLAISLALLDLLYEPADYSDLMHEMELNIRRKRKKVVNVSKSVVNKMDKLARRYVLFPMDIRWFYEITRKYLSPFWTRWDVPAMKKRKPDDQLFLWRRDGYAPLVYPKKRLPVPDCSSSEA